MEINVNGKQRAYLRSLATNLDVILTVGKGGMSDTIIKQADDALTAREILKGRVLETSPTDVAAIASEIAERTNSLLVHVMGSTFVLYRRNEENPVITLPKVRKK